MTGSPSTATLDAGADPLTIAGWMREVKGERLAAERELGLATATDDPLTLDQVRALIRGVHDAVAVLSSADPKLKAQVHRELGIEITYQPSDGQAVVSARVGQCVSEGGTRTLTPRALRPSEYSVAA
jgi:site-specific DNA recombinase